MNPGTVYWLTGLSGAGKSTLCVSLADYIRSFGRQVIVLDGDELRSIFGLTESNYTRQERLQVAMRYARLSQLLASQGVDVAIATISMYKEIYAWNRENIPFYKEIFIDVPMSELQQRDPKGLYKRAHAQEIKNVAGLDMEVDLPPDPDIHVKWHSGLTPEDALSHITKSLNLNHLKENRA